jgi:hypothetical protein
VRKGGSKEEQDHALAVHRSTHLLHAVKAGKAVECRHCTGVGTWAEVGPFVRVGTHSVHSKCVDAFKKAARAGQVSLCCVVVCMTWVSALSYSPL